MVSLGTHWGALQVEGPERTVWFLTYVIGVEHSTIRCETRNRLHPVVTNDRLGPTAAARRQYSTEEYAGAYSIDLMVG